MNEAPVRKRSKRGVRLGFCPIGKFVFSHEDALVQKGKIITVLRGLGVDFCDLDGVLPDGLIRGQQHVGPAVEHFRQQRIDALFIPHCNFGTEGAAAMIARHCGVPTLLWAPRDEAPLADGTQSLGAVRRGEDHIPIPDGRRREFPRRIAQIEAG